VSPDLANPAPGSPLRRTRPRRQQTVEAKAHFEDDSAAPKPRLPDRTAESSTTQPSTAGVIFDPAGVIFDPAGVIFDPAGVIFDPVGAAIW
jgi:hypothetical protein